MSFNETTYRSLGQESAPRPETLIGLHPQPIFRSAPETKAAVDFPEAPIYIEKYTSFMCDAEVSKTPMRVIGSLCGYFEKSDNIDYNLKKRSKKIKGIAYIDNEPVSFKVCVWRKNGDLLVEVQRRSGDAIAFSKFYSNLKTNLGSLVSGPFQKASFRFESKNSLSAPSLFAPSLSPPAISALDMIEIGSELAGMVKETDAKNNFVTLDNKTMSTLCTMVSQEVGQCKYDAARILASLSSTPENQKALASFTAEKVGKFTNVIKSLLQAPDPEISRCGSTLAANMANHGDSRKDILETLLESLISSIQTPELSMLDRERKRQSALALSLLSESHAAHMRSSEAPLRSCSAQTEDHRLQTTLNTVLRRIV